MRRDEPLCKVDVVHLARLATARALDRGRKGIRNVHRGSQCADGQPPCIPARWRTVHVPTWMEFSLNACVRAAMLV